VIVRDAAVRLCCSAACQDAALRGVPLEEPPPLPRRRRFISPLATGGAVLGSLFVSDSRTEAPPQPSIAPPPAIVVPQVVAAAVAAPELPPPPVYGPSWPPTEAQWVAVISRDVWLHPLNGPIRRMPARDSRVFGAERDGKRPPGCRNGHCGVDIGGEVWGEPVMAAHAGVVDRVHLGPNEDNGGLYVRLAHRGGTVFTQYFHLAAIPRWIRAGREVAAGEVIGLLGDTGVKKAGPHLHFTISVKAAPHMAEQYIDPEPLIALWPLRVPGDGGGSVVSIDSTPGRVRGAAAKRRKRRAPRDDVTTVSDAPPTVQAAAPDAPAMAPP